MQEIDNRENQEPQVSKISRTDIPTVPPIPPEYADRYAAALERMIASVTRQLGEISNIQALIGTNPHEMMATKQRHHGQFMLTVFQLNSFDLLIRTAPWFYRTYHSRGFSHDYFPLELQAWQKALEEQSVDDASGPICRVYDWLISHHEALIELSQRADTLSFSLPHDSDGMQQMFTTLLLHGDHSGCLTLAEQSIASPADLRHFYEHTIRHALYAVGTLWERNEISVAEEHQATAIVGRVTSFLYGRFVGTPQTKGTAIVTAAPNEFHEVGARMVADILELDGWDVTYLGANIPVADLLQLLKQKQPFLLALSVATPLNLEKARMVIDMLKRDAELSCLRILVGGLAFSIVPGLWQEFGADGYAENLDDLTALCDRWWQEGVERQ
jgi:methanogenic corrinoid protein MtbC1